MDYGLFGFNVGGLSTPDSIERIVVSAEQIGYESVWTAEHVVMIDPQAPQAKSQAIFGFLDAAPRSRCVPELVK